MSESNALVVDASSAVKLFVDEEDSDQARALFSRIGLTLYVPDLFFVECANVLWKKVRRGDYSAVDAARGLSKLRQMDLTVTSTADLVERAFTIAQANDITAYDACYVALAENLHIPLVTADERLAAKLKSGTVSVVTLAEIE